MYIDLFAGCGGLSLGLKNAGWRGLFAVEKNSDAFLTLQRNLIDNENHFNWPEWIPVENIDINDLLKEKKTDISRLKGTVDLIVGGPPCQGFSMAGKRKGNDIRNQLYNSYIEFVELVEPRMLFFENVHGFTVGFKRKYKGKVVNGEAYSEKLVKSLKRLGYRVGYKVIDMSEYGVPQKRKRFILFAIKDQNPQRFFDILDKNRTVFLQSRGLSRRVSVEEAIGDLRRIYGEQVLEESPRFFCGAYGPVQSNYQEYMRRNIRDELPNSHRFARQKESTIRLFTELMNVSTEMMRVTPSMNLVEGLRKRGVTPLKPNEVCSTITSIPDDFIHYSEPRIMTVRECARIQSFPDDFIFCGKYTTGGSRRKLEVPRYTQVANAVPPLFAEQVGLALMEMINNE